MIGSTAMITPVSRPASDPTIQKRYSSSVLVSKISTALVSEMSMAVRTAPASASRIALGPSRPEPSTRTSTAVAPAPASAKTAYPVADPTPRSEMAITTAKAAPALMPRVPGSASALRVVPCISAPAAPSAAPTSSPSSVRGTRRSRTMACASLPSYAVKAATTSASGMCCEPMARDATTHRTSSSTDEREARDPRPAAGQECGTLRPGDGGRSC